MNLSPLSEGVGLGPHFEQRAHGLTQRAGQDGQSEENRRFVEADGSRHSKGGSFAIPILRGELDAVKLLMLDAPQTVFHQHLVGLRHRDRVIHAVKRQAPHKKLHIIRKQPQEAILFLPPDRGLPHRQAPHLFKDEGHPAHIGPRDPTTLPPAKTPEPIVPQVDGPVESPPAPEGTV